MHYIFYHRTKINQERVTDRSFFIMGLRICAAIITNKQPITLYHKNEISVKKKQQITTASAKIAARKAGVAFTFLK